MKTEIEEFAEFVRARGRNERIDHNKDGERGAWCGCAVGEFLTIEDYPTRLSMDPFLSDLARTLPRTHDALNNCSVHTYGSLAALIAYELEKTS